MLCLRITIIPPLWGFTSDSKGAIWVGTNSGAASFNGTQWTFHRKDHMLRTDSLNTGSDVIRTDSKGNLWVAGNSGISRLISPGKWKWYGISMKEHYDLRPGIKEMIIDNNDSLWCVTDGALLCLVNDTLMPVSPPPGFLKTEMRGLALTREGNLMVCGGGSNSGDQGVAVRENGSWKLFRNTEEPIIINTMAVDKAGSLWGTGTCGITRFDGKKWQYWGTTTGMSDTNFAIAIDRNNNVWVTSYNGVSRFDGTKWTKYKLSNEKHWREYFSSITVDSSNNIWVTHTPYDSIGTFVFEGIVYPHLVVRETNIYRYQNNKDAWETISLPAEAAYSGIVYENAIATDPTGAVWLVTSGVYDKDLKPLYPLYRYGTDGSVEVFYLQNNGNDSTRSRAATKLAFDRKGVLWAAYESSNDRPGGVASFDGTTWRDEIYDTLQFEDTRTVTIDPEGTVWITTSLRKNGNLKTSRTYFKKNGIWKEYTDIDRVIKMAFDHNGNVWLLRAGSEIVKISNIDTVGVEEETQPIAGQGDATLYPNPVKDYIALHTSLSGNLHTRIHTLLGETVVERSVYSDDATAEIRLPVSALAQGVYFITVSSSEKSVTRMFVKE